MNLNNWQTQLRKGLLDIVILNLLWHGQCYGYEMVQILKQSDRLMICKKLDPKQASFFKLRCNRVDDIIRIQLSCSSRLAG